MQQNCHSDNFLDQLRAFPPPFGQSPSGLPITQQLLLFGKVDPEQWAISWYVLEGEQGVFLFLTYTCKISVKAIITLRHFERQGTIFLTFAADRFEAGIQCQRSVSCLNCASVAFMKQKQVNIWQFCCLILKNSGRSCFQFLSFINIKKPAGRKDNIWTFCTCQNARIIYFCSSFWRVAVVTLDSLSKPLKHIIIISFIHKPLNHIYL